MWKPLKASEWKSFKAEKLKKWLEPISLPLSVYEEADRRYNKLMQQKKLLAEEHVKAGESVEDWETAEDPERKVGWRGQKWLSEMLFDLKVAHLPELGIETSLDDHWREIKEKLVDLGLRIQDWIDLKYKWEINPDINIWDFGTVEVKTSFNIKKNAWDSKPSLYLVVVKVCDEEMLEFQVSGWLYGHDVYKLKVQERLLPLYPKAHYFGDAKDLRKPKEFLQKVLEVSKANPKSPARA
jgi:hypothetical protein